MLSLYNIAKFDGRFKGKSYCRVTHSRTPVADITLPIGGLYQGRSESAPTTRNHGVCGEIPRAHTVRPYIHVNRSPNNLRKPSSDLKLIALTKVSERSKRIVIAPPLAQRQGPPKAAPTENNSFNYVWANAQAFKPDHKKEKSDRRERGKGLREKRVQRGKPTGKRREGGCRILLRFSFSPLSLSQEVFLFG